MGKLTPRKEKALRALLVSRTRAEAAKTAGIGESTLREYMKDAEFMERYKQAFGGAVAVSGTGQSEASESLATPAFVGFAPIAKNSAKAALTTGMTTDRKNFIFTPRRGIMAEK